MTANGYSPHPRLTEQDIRVLHITASLLDSHAPGYALFAGEIACAAELPPNQVRHSLRKLAARGLVMFGNHALARVIGLIYEPDSAVEWRGHGR